MEFLIGNLQYIVMAAGAIGSAFYIKHKRSPSISDNISKYLVDIKRQDDRLNKRSKSVM